MTGRLRLWSGYVLFFYVVTHLLNHALGLISLRVLEEGRHWFAFVWSNPAGLTVLYGALFGHFCLALWSLYRRRALKLSRWEWTQWILGASIIPLGVIHVVGTRLAETLYDVESGYPWVLGSLVAGSWTGILRQFSLPLVVWMHGCIGLHFALRLKPWYGDWLPLLYGLSLLSSRSVPASSKPCSSARMFQRRSRSPTSIRSRPGSNTPPSRCCSWRSPRAPCAISGSGAPAWCVSTTRNDAA
jgi:adenylate cyclase